jgi:glycosyltransferase involved in cell wall biosynthesis
MHPTILFVGTWAGRKRGAMLADAFERGVRSQHPNAELWMVSDYAPPRPGIIHFKHPSDAELAELYKRAWLFCLPSAYEGFGIPYLEAMAAGTPVIATSNPGADHLLDRGRFGVVSDEKRLEQTLAALVDSPNDRRHYGALGLQRASDFSWDAIVDRHLAAYEWAISKHRKRA